MQMCVGAANMKVLVAQSYLQSQCVERLWHLYIPPIMTLLDDHQAKYKLQGVQLVSQLLEVVPPALLRRTGIDTLLLGVGLDSRPALLTMV